VRSVWQLYDTLLADLPPQSTVQSIRSTRFWTMAELPGGALGIAMTTGGDSRPPLFTDGLSSLTAAEGASAVKSWNLPEASGGMAVLNACYNTEARLKEFNCEVPYHQYCTHGLDLTGKTVGLIGHLKMPRDALTGAKQVYILERQPQPGDYPDSACEYLLPLCDVVLITGSALVNKTLPRLLQLSRNACTILTGPTVPLCPALLELGIDRLAGLVITDSAGLRRHLADARSGPPYPYGKTFLLTRY